MSVNQSVVTSLAKKDYSEFQKIISKEVETRMKSHLTGFTNYIEKTAFNTDKD